MREYDDIDEGADERYRRERYLCVRDTFARISSAATRPGGNTRPDERANCPNRRKGIRLKLERPKRATSATTSTLAAIRACFHLPVKKKSVLFEITPAGTPIATVDMSMWRYVDARRISTSSAHLRVSFGPPPARESNQTWTHNICLRDCRGCRHGRSDMAEPHLLAV